MSVIGFSLSGCNKQGNDPGTKAISEMVNGFFFNNRNVPETLAMDLPGDHLIGMSDRSWSVSNIDYETLKSEERSFNGRSLPGADVKVTIHWINQSAGEKDTTCIIVSATVDKEFDMIRDISDRKC